MSSDGPVSPAGVLELARRRSIRGDWLRAYKVFIDDVEVGRVRPGQTAVFPLELGQHRIQLRLGRYSSAAVGVHVREDTRMRLYCYCNVHQTGALATYRQDPGNWIALTPDPSGERRAGVAETSQALVVMTLSTSADGSWGLDRWQQTLELGVSDEQLGNAIIRALQESKQHVGPRYASRVRWRARFRRAARPPKLEEVLSSAMIVREGATSVVPSRCRASTFEALEGSAATREDGDDASALGRATRHALERGKRAGHR